MLRDQTPAASHGTTRKARALRRTMTLPEVLLWQRLRARPVGLKFRRQHPTGPYIFDFYCVDAALAVEIDGHMHVAQVERDAARDAWLARAGIATLRLTAGDVLRDGDAVADQVVVVARSRLPLHHPAAPGGPPPRAKLGED